MSDESKLAILIGGFIIVLATVSALWDAQIHSWIKMAVVGIEVLATGWILSQSE